PAGPLGHPLPHDLSGSAPPPEILVSPAVSGISSLPKYPKNPAHSRQGRPPLRRYQPAPLPIPATSRHETRAKQAGGELQAPLSCVLSGGPPPPEILVSPTVSGISSLPKYLKNPAVSRQGRPLLRRYQPAPLPIPATLR